MGQRGELGPHGCYVLDGGGLGVGAVHLEGMSSHNSGRNGPAPNSACNRS